METIAVQKNKPFLVLSKARSVLAVLLFFALARPTLSYSQSAEDAGAERLVMAAYLYNFVNWVEWPPRTFAAPDSPLKIGFVGADALAEEFGRLAARRVHPQRQLTAVKLRGDAAPEGIHILFVGYTNKAQLADQLTRLRGKPVLTVTDSEQGLNLGSMINFLTIDGKLRFEIAPKAAETSGLYISARLLTVSYRSPATSAKFPIQ